MSEGYLIHIPAREHEAVKRLFVLPPSISGRIFGSLGLVPLFSWYLLQTRKEGLVATLKGDVDILAGRLDWKDTREFESNIAKEAKKNPEAHPSWHYYFATQALLNSDGIMWPPSTDYLIGIEAKCAYLDPSADHISENAIKSRKSSQSDVRHTRAQVKSLLQMGFDRVVLLDIIANPPATGPDGQAWLLSSYIAKKSTGAMFPVLKDRLPADSLAGHWVWSAGAVAGGDETRRGAGAPVELREAYENLFLKSDPGTISQRREMERRLNTLLAGLPSPRDLPAVFIDCRSCRRIHRLMDVCDTV
jgi:hypothetical protein